MSRVEKSMSPKSVSLRRISSTRLTLSKNSCQSNAEIKRMLVMMLRTDTFAVPCCWCSVRTISSAFVPAGSQALIEPDQHGPELLDRDPAGAGQAARQTLFLREHSQSGGGPTAEWFQLDHSNRASRSANASASWRAFRLRTICSAILRKFSTSTTRSVMATAQSSPIVSGCTR